MYVIKFKLEAGIRDRRTGTVFDSPGYEEETAPSTPKSSTQSAVSQLEAQQKAATSCILRVVNFCDWLGCG